MVPYNDGRVVRSTLRGPTRDDVVHGGVESLWKSFVHEMGIEPFVDLRRVCTQHLEHRVLQHRDHLEHRVLQHRDHLEHRVLQHRDHLEHRFTCHAVDRGVVLVEFEELLGGVVGLVKVRLIACKDAHVLWVLLPMGLHNDQPGQRSQYFTAVVWKSTSGNWNHPLKQKKWAQQLEQHCDWQPKRVAPIATP